MTDITDVSNFDSIEELEEYNNSIKLAFEKTKKAIKERDKLKEEEKITKLFPDLTASFKTDEKKKIVVDHLLKFITKNIYLADPKLIKRLRNKLSQEESGVVKTRKATEFKYQTMNIARLEKEAPTLYKHLTAIEKFTPLKDYKKAIVVYRKIYSNAAKAAALKDGFETIRIALDSFAEKEYFSLTILENTAELKIADFKEVSKVDKK